LVVKIKLAKGMKNANFTYVLVFDRLSKITVAGHFPVKYPFISGKKANNKIPLKSFRY